MASPPQERNLTPTRLPGLPHPILTCCIREPARRAGRGLGENGRSGGSGSLQPVQPGPRSCFRSASSDGDGLTRSLSSSFTTLVREPLSSFRSTSVPPHCSLTPSLAPPLPPRPPPAPLT